MNFNQIEKALAIKDDKGHIIGMKGEWKIELSKGQLQNPHKKVHRELKKQEKKLRKIKEKNNG